MSKTINAAHFTEWVLLDKNIILYTGYGFTTECIINALCFHITIIKGTMLLYHFAMDSLSFTQKDGFTKAVYLGTVL